MKKIIGVAVLTGVMAFSGVAMASDKGFASGYGLGAAMQNMAQDKYSGNQVLSSLGGAQQVSQGATAKAITGSGVGQLQNAPNSESSEKEAANQTLDAWARTQQKTDVECSGTTHLYRPMWQRILSLGLLGEVVEVDEFVVAKDIPGGTKVFKFLKSRNPEFNLFLARETQYRAPAAFESYFVCTSKVGGDVNFHYYQHDGLARLEMTAP